MAGAGARPDDKGAGRSPADIFGQEILLDRSRIRVVAANGELVFCDGLAAAVQDIKLRVFTYLHGLFYDYDFGSLIPDWIHEENTKSSRLGLAAEVKRRIEMDSRVLAGTVTAKILAWDELGIKIDAAWRFWDTPEPQNMTITLERPGGRRLLEDITPNDLT